jgi:hypothetical protein
MLFQEMIAVYSEHKMQGYWLLRQVVHIVTTGLEMVKY